MLCRYHFFVFGGKGKRGWGFGFLELTN